MIAVSKRAKVIFLEKGKVRYTPLVSVGGCSSSSPRPWARRWRTINVCDEWPMRRQIYVYLPCCKASLPIGWYQIILLGDRGTCVLTTYPGSTRQWDGQDSNPRLVDRKSSILTTQPLSHTESICLYTKVTVDELWSYFSCQIVWMDCVLFAGVGIADVNHYRRNWQCRLWGYVWRASVCSLYVTLNISSVLKFTFQYNAVPFSALTLLVGWQEGHPVVGMLAVAVTFWLELCTSLYSSMC